MPIVIYVGNNCTACLFLKGHLQRLNLMGRVVLRNIDADAAARAAFQASGARAVPTAIVGGRAVSGAQEILTLVQAS